ncbi:MAG: hypothetical protein U0T78_09255 [Cloacibacterium normanense]
MWEKLGKNTSVNLRNYRIK